MLHTGYNTNMEEIPKKDSKFKKGSVPWNKGKKRPEMTGEKHPMWGKTHSVESKIKIGIASKNRIVTKETRDKLSNKMLGNTRGFQKGVSVRKGVKLSDEAKKRISLIQTSKKRGPMSIETKRKLEDYFLRLINN